ncbi:MAG: acyl carrier protein [Candidatus Thiothrix singaporensis]|uniref:Acyl carrier protein n=1 Tax=Candidatus Thiothrix singaporensis TaxID=2799669 RepID=A0A7L6AVF1_9GAMM|nr:MAG: acyl carrier protein [Candidatus Thiothrix singaporensis]
MDSTKVKETLKQAIAAVLGKPLPDDENVWLAMNGRKDWDSLKQVEILLVLEEEFGIRYTEEEFAQLDTAADIVALTVHKCDEETSAPTDDGLFSYY